MTDYYTATSDPADNTDAEPLVLRTEHASIQAGFAKIAGYTGNAGKIVAINSAGTAQEAIATTGTGDGVRATSPTLVTPLLGTPTSGTLTNCTGYPVSALAGLGTGVATFLATPSSANLAAAITDETGSGALVFATSPTLVTPVLGVATATSINKVAITAPATSATLTIADGKTLTASNTLTFAGTDGSTLNIGAGGTLGTAATKNTGTSGNTVPLLDGNNTHSGDITMSAASIIETEGAAVASAATTDIWATDGNTKHITGTTTITSLGTAPQAGAWMKVIFDGALTLTHGADLNLPGGANITTAAGDFAFVYADTTTQFDVLYFRADGTAVVATSSAVFTSAFESAEITYAGDASGSAAAAHGLGAIPKKWEALIRCKTAEFNYSVGDEVLMGGSTANGNPPLVSTADATNITVSWQDVRSISNKTTGVGTGALTNANWKWVLRAWK